MNCSSFAIPCFNVGGSLVHAAYKCFEWAVGFELIPDAVVAASSFFQDGLSLLLIQ